MMTVRPVRSKRAFMLVPRGWRPDATRRTAPAPSLDALSIDRADKPIGSCGGVRLRETRNVALRRRDRPIMRALYRVPDGYFRDSRRRRHAPAFPAGAALPRARAAGDRRRHAARAAAGVGGVRAQRAGRSAVHLLAHPDREDRLAARPRR